MPTNVSLAFAWKRRLNGEFHLEVPCCGIISSVFFFFFTWLDVCYFSFFFCWFCCCVHAYILCTLFLKFCGDRFFSFYLSLTQKWKLVPFWVSCFLVWVREKNRKKETKDTWINVAPSPKWYPNIGFNAYVKHFNWNVHCVFLKIEQYRIALFSVLSFAFQIHSLHRRSIDSYNFARIHYSVHLIEVNIAHVSVVICARIQPWATYIFLRSILVVCLLARAFLSVFLSHSLTLFLAFYSFKFNRMSWVHECSMNE